MARKERIGGGPGLRPAGNDSGCAVCGKAFSFWSRPEDIDGETYRCSRCLRLVHPGECMRSIEVKGDPQEREYVFTKLIGNRFLVHETGVNPERMAMVKRYNQLGIYLCPDCFADLGKTAVPETVSYLERADRDEDAARICEFFGRPEEAGRIRRRSQAKMVTNVNVDLNRLLEAVKANGICVPFKCTSCGASIKIDGSAGADGITHCSYCGSTMDTASLGKILEQLLGYR